MKFDHLQSHPVKLYKRVRISQATPEAEQQYDFLYIGGNRDVFDYLEDVFKVGYYTENFQKAAKLLLEKPEEIRPKCIFIDLPYERGTRSFFELLNGVREFQEIPVIYNTSALETTTIHSLQKMQQVDDVVELAKIDKWLIFSKVRMLYRFKQSHVNKNSVKVTIENGDNSIYDVSTNYLKRGFDIILTPVLLLLLLPVFLIIALAIKLESRGPVFYTSLRAGRGYKIFNFYKFRTMEIDADKKVQHLMHLNQYHGGSSVFFKVNNDPRVTKVGAFLRKTSLDELPQLFNVLLGDMSLVGNRPLPLYEAASLTTDEWAGRFMAPAGITGLWQIKKRGKKDMSVEERINLDIAYAHQHNFIYDLWIIANTPSALMQKERV